MTIGRTLRLAACLSLFAVACGDDADLQDAPLPGVDGTDARVDAGPLPESGVSAAGDAAPGSDSGRAGDGARGPTSGKWVLGYYAAYQRELLPPAEVDWSGLSHVVFTRIKVGPGGLLLDFDVDAQNGPVLARDIATRAHQNGKKALLMLGGEGEGTSIKAACSSQRRAAFVSALLKAVKDLGYDGLDLDWEDDLDYDLFTALASDLRRAPEAPKELILTAPGIAINANITQAEPKLPALIEHLDLYSPMTYSPATAVAGYGWLSWHTSPLGGRKDATPVTIEDTLQRYTALGVPAGKLGIGIGFYAICYTGGVTAPNQSTENGVTIVGGDNDFPLSALFDRSSPYKTEYRKWDDVAKVPYLTLPTADRRGCRYVSFDDEQSLEAKGAFAKQHGYGGAIVWTLNQGVLRNSDKPQNALTQALKRGFLDP